MSFPNKNIIFSGVVGVFLLLGMKLFSVSNSEGFQWEIATTNSNSAKSNKDSIKIVCFGDTHSHHEDIHVPDADVLIYTGDMTDPHSDVPCQTQVNIFNKWLGTLPHKHKIVVAGNHDAEDGMTLGDLRRSITNAIYLQDSMTTVDVKGKSLNIWGTPWQPQYPGGETYFDPQSPEIMRKWDLIPEDAHIVASHSPPFGIQDVDPKGNHVGSKGLADALINRVNPILSCFGHIHISQGYVFKHGTIWSNGAVCNDDLVAIHDPFAVDITLP